MLPRVRLAFSSAPRIAGLRRHGLKCLVLQQVNRDAHHVAPGNMLMRLDCPCVRIVPLANGQTLQALTVTRHVTRVALAHFPAFLVKRQTHVARVQRGNMLIRLDCPRVRIVPLANGQTLQALTVTRHVSRVALAHFPAFLVKRQTHVSSVQRVDIVPPTVLYAKCAPLANGQTL